MKMRAPASRINAFARALFLVLLSALTSAGQRVSDWRVYKMADGLSESACVSVNLTTQGKVLARHLNETWASQLDGYSIQPVALPDGAIGRVYEGPSGQLWTVVARGLQEFWDGRWSFHSVPEIAAEVRVSPSRALNPVPLCIVRQGVALCLLPDRLIEFNAADSDQGHVTVIMTAAQTGLGKFIDLSQPRDRESGLWIAGANGLVHVPAPLRNLKSGGDWTVHLVPSEIRIGNFQAPHEAQSGVFLIADSATLQKLVVHFDGKSWNMVRAPSEKFRHAWQDTDGIVWACSINAIFHQDPASQEFIEDEELSGRRLFDVAVEPGGAFWVATGDGLFRHAPMIWRIPPVLARFTGPVHSVASDASGTLWFVTSGGMHSLDGQKSQDFSFPTNWPRLEQPSRFLLPLKDGSLLFESDDQLARFRPADGAFEFVASSEHAYSIRPLGPLKDGNLCVQRLASEASDRPVELASFDGRNFVPLADSVPASMPTGSLTAMLEARNGDLWIAGDRASGWCHDHHWQVFASSSTDHTGPEGILHFAELPGGKIWCATVDKIWQFDGRIWIEVRGSFDHINGLTPGRDGSLWVASNNGVQRFSQTVWLENNIEEGLASPAIRAICEDSRGGIWAATTRGLCRFHPESDRDPPQTNLQVLSERERNIHEGETINLTFHGLDKWKFTNRDRLQYSYYLDEREWSPYQESRTVPFSELPIGKHYFQVRAMDRAGNVDPQPARLDFAIVLPWYRESRLVLISFAGLIAVLFFAGLAVNRHLRLLRSYAEVEQIVTQRTRELERANRELLHSQKMNALGVLAAGIAHDFNNILSIVKGSAQIIEDNLQDTPKIRTRLDRIKTVVEQGSGIVRAMLGFSRDSGQEFRPSNLNSVVEETLKLLGDRFLREVSVRFDSAPELPAVKASSDFIQQILLNFIFNAAESMTSRKEIVITTSRLQTVPPSLVLRPGKGTEYVSVAVRDTGCGIPPEIMSRIFEPFFTTKALSARRGTGLGLSMVYELARKVEAGICVESVPDQGSTFTLILVAVAAPKPEPQLT